MSHHGGGQKNYVLKGGISGQDGTAVQPVPQPRSPRTKVITQNYKAESPSFRCSDPALRSRLDEFHAKLIHYFDQDMRATRPPSAMAERSINGKQYGFAPVTDHQEQLFFSPRQREFVTRAK